MYRNLSRRVELLTPIKDAQLRSVLRETLLAGYLKDNVNARELQSNGTYVRLRPAEGDKRFDAQLEFETAEFSPSKRDRVRVQAGLKARTERASEASKL